MASFRIIGGTPLCGTVQASGSKNAALPMMAASILAEGPVRLKRVPRLVDVETLSRVLVRLGMEVTWTAEDEMTLCTVDPTPVRAEYQLVRPMRASFCVLGPLLARRRRAIVSLPGGCNIGDRPVDLHLKGLAALGAELRLRHGYVVARAERLVGTTIDLSGPRGPTVTGTANVLCAAVLAQGKTILRGAAREPEVVDLGRFLISMGARIDGLGTETLEIDGVEQLDGTTHRIIPDRIETATLLLAAAITQGSVTVGGVTPSHLEAVLEVLEATGARLDRAADRITLSSDGPPRPVEIIARPFPGIPTDLQAQFMALLSLAAGRSRIGDEVFPDRFLHTAELQRLGAKIRRNGPMAEVTGVDRLAGATVTACDLRASAALVLAGLAARGRTTVRQIHHLDRGYERLDEKLGGLGARIQRREMSGTAK